MLNLENFQWIWEFYESLNLWNEAKNSQLALRSEIKWIIFIFALFSNNAVFGSIQMSDVLSFNQLNDNNLTRILIWENFANWI